MSAYITRLPLFILVLCVCWTCCQGQCPSNCRCNVRKREVRCQGRSGNVDVSDIPANTRILNLRGNEFDTIEAYAFAHLLSLTHLYVQENKIRKIAANAFIGLRRLTHLRLSGNKLTTLRQGVFSGLTALRELVLSENSIGDIQDDVFQPLKNLLVFNIKNNEMISISDDIFTGLSKLKVLNLSNNKLELISTPTFFPLQNLRKLFMDNNQLNGVPSQALSGGAMFRLVTLSLRHNKIQHIGDKAFASLRNLVVLFLSNNEISSLSPTSFSGIPKLKSLQLNGNKLKYIQEMPPMPNLGKFGLAYNLWECDCKMQEFRRWIESTAFDLECKGPSYLNDRKFKSLDIEDLYCDEKQYYALHKDRFRPLLQITLERNDIVEHANQEEQFYCPHKCTCDTSLKHLDCDSKSFTSVPTGLSEETTLINLRNNRIKSIQEGSFFSLTSLVSLHLQYNRIRRIESRAFEGLHNLVYLYLEDNNLDTLDAESFVGLRRLSYLFLDRNRLGILPPGIFRPLTSVFSIYIRDNLLESISPQNFDGVERLRWLYLSGNRLNYLEDNTFRSVPDMERLLLDRNEFTSVPAEAFKGLGYLLWLDLSQNRIDRLNTNNFRRQPRLSKLLLGANRIQEVDKKAFYGLHSLQMLNISNNNLKVLPPFERSSSLIEINTEGNPWRCDCEIIPFRDWLIKLKTTINPSLTMDSVICSSPLKLKNENMLLIANEQLCGHRRRRENLRERKLYRLVAEARNFSLLNVDTYEMSLKHEDEVAAQYSYGIALCLNVCFFME
ncbi:uncharacterized protein LOC120340642 [Styela clava]